MKLIKKGYSVPVRNDLMRAIVLMPKDCPDPVPGILWIHGGGYVTGMASMVNFSRAREIAKTYGAVVVSPEYRVAKVALKPYASPANTSRRRIPIEENHPTEPTDPPVAAVEDCYSALLWMQAHAEDLHIDPNRIIVGGESAGGGLAIAMCMVARERGDVRIAAQIPLYPMIDCRDTESNRDNHGHVWNTKRNRAAWAKYLNGMDPVPVYASPALCEDYHDLPPCCTFVCDGEPFYSETVSYVNHLNEAGVRAAVDIYPGSTHAFAMLLPFTKKAKKARKKLLSEYEKLISGL